MKIPVRQIITSIILMTIISLSCYSCMPLNIFLNKETKASVVKLLEPTQTAIIVPLFGQVSENWAIDVEKALKTPNCELVILWIESPGGGFTESILLTHKLKVLQKKYQHPIFIYSERILASGAYWVATAFEKIITAPSGRTGSIGVYIVRKDFSKVLDSNGIKYYYIASDSLKIMGHPEVPMQEWERAYWQWTINNAYISFVNHIWGYRAPQLINAYETINQHRIYNTMQDTLKAFNYFKQFTNGLTYSAQNAKNIGLIDEVLYFNEVIKKIYAIGYTPITLDGGTIITEFYPFKCNDPNKEKINNLTREHIFLMEYK